MTEKQEAEFEKLFNSFIKGDGMYLPDKLAYRYFYKKGLETRGV